MPPTYLRGGIPAHINETTGTATVEEWVWEGAEVANYFWFKNISAGTITLSFTRADAVAGIGITVLTGVVWEGPTEIGGFYTVAVAPLAFEAVAFRRRG